MKSSSEHTPIAILAVAEFIFEMRLKRQGGQYRLFARR
jgi:hypothetical protein